MSNYKYISLPISVLESNNISKDSFMRDSDDAQSFLERIFQQLPPYLELKNTFLIRNIFILQFKNKKNFTFTNHNTFDDFTDFIKNTKFNDKVTINSEKKEISMSKDISPIFYNLLYEFLI